MIVGGFLLTVSGTVAHEFGVVGVLVLVLVGVIAVVWTLASGLAWVIRSSGEDIKRDLGGE
jgi:hypothetical protein